MATQQDNEKIIWVAGNKQSVIIPMEKEVIPKVGDPYTEDFYPAEDDVVKVTLTGAYRPFIYTPEVDGHLLILTDPGTLPKGLYGVQITVLGASGETRLRSFWDQQIVVTERNNSVLKEWDEFKQQSVQARAAVFFFAKGDKGDPFTYEDFTPEEIEELQKPATDAAAKVAALEQNIEAAEALRVEAEQVRVVTAATDHGTAVADHTTAAGDHTQAGTDHSTASADHTLASSDHTTAGTDHTTAGNDHTQAVSDHGTATTDHEAYEQAIGTINSKLDEITKEQFNEIFN